MVQSQRRRLLLLAFAFTVCWSVRSKCNARQSSGTRDEDSVTPLKVASRDGPSSFGRTRIPGSAWVPPDVDESVPPVDQSATCSISDVLSGAGRRLEELVNNLQRFRATETIRHQRVDRSGRLGQPETAKFDYIVSITNMDSGLLDLEEHRQGYRNSDQFPDNVETKGVPSLVVIFYPPYTKKFDMHCEGLGQWHGQPAWQVHFEENDDPHDPMSGIQIGQQFFALRLRGRAWILADSYQVARLETDLQQTISKIRLRLQHEDIEYCPVYFRDSKVEMWLPSTAELYMDFVGHRFYRLHSFTDFQLFSVTAHQVFGPPILDKPTQKEK